MLAPTGTISFLMDCDTTGVEPDFSLVKFKELVGGGQMTIVNRTVPMALRTLGYSDEQIEQIEAHIDEHGHDRRRARPGRRAPAGVRRGRRRARDLAHGPHQDDGRGPAVHLGRDLQDGEHAADGDGRGHRRRLHRRPGAAASRRWPSTATARRRRRRCAPTPRQGSRAPTASPRPWPRRSRAVRPGGGRRRGRQGGHQGQGRGRPGAPADAARAPVDHPQVLDRRPRGLHHRRHVRGRHASARSSSPTSARRARRCAA